MGFGLLFLGVVLLLPTCFGYFYTVPVSAVVLVLALRKLAKVNTPFGYAMWLAILFGAGSVVEVVCRLLHWDVVTSVLDGVLYGCLLVFWVLVFTGLEWVSTETGLSALRTKAYRQKVFCVIYLLPLLPLNFLVGSQLPEAMIRLMSSLSLALMVVGMVVMVLNMTTIYEAYMRICMPEDLEMEEKPSRFAFINKMREARKARDEERAAREIQAYQEAMRRKQQRKKKK